MMSPVRWVVVMFAFALGCAGERATTPAPLALQDGKHVLATEDLDWPGISSVWYYRPPADRVAEDAAGGLRVLMVIHGAGRNAEQYLDSWLGIAEEHGLFVVAPEFSEENGIRVGGEWEWRFNTGNVVGWFGNDTDEEDWYFTSVERLFESIRRSDGRVLDRYVIFGHSAGGQFVHRMMLFQPEAHFELAIAANSGWYTLPDAERDFPYGLLGAPFSTERIDAALQRPLIVFLGTDDTPDQGSFRTSDEAMAQGATRPLRGARFFEEATRLAKARGLPLGWTLEYAEGIGHDKHGMASASVRLLQERGLLPAIQPEGTGDR
jgi:poly(3-hydroxybutyrate) depolymerase